MGSSTCSLEVAWFILSTLYDLSISAMHIRFNSVLQNKVG